MTKKEVLAKHWCKMANTTYVTTGVFKPEDFKKPEQWILDAMEEYSEHLEKENKILHERIEALVNEL